MAVQVIVVDAVVVHALALAHIHHVGILPVLVRLRAHLHDAVLGLRCVILHARVVAHAGMLLPIRRQRQRAAGVREVYVVVHLAVYDIIALANYQAPVVPVRRHRGLLADDVHRPRHRLVTHVPSVLYLHPVLFGKPVAAVVTVRQPCHTLYPASGAGIAHVTRGECKLPHIQLRKHGLLPHV